VTAVDRVSLAVMPGETLAIVGESGSGKSTLGRLLLRLLAASEGRVFYQGRDHPRLGRALNQLRRELQIIFQDPFASLNPRMTVEQIVGEPLWLHQNMKKGDRQYRVAELLKTVGLPAAWPGATARVFRRAAPAYRHCARAGLRTKAAAGR
jgi:peptide/nickel transport system ATP-binding protein